MPELNPGHADGFKPLGKNFTRVMDCIILSVVQPSSVLESW